MFLHSLALSHAVFQLGYLELSFKYQFFYFQVCDNMVEENRMCKQLQKSCREKVSRIKVFRANFRKFSQNILSIPKIATSYTYSFPTLVAITLDPFLRGKTYTAYPINSESHQKLVLRTKNKTIFTAVYWYWSMQNFVSRRKIGTMFSVGSGSKNLNPLI